MVVLGTCQKPISSHCFHLHDFTICVILYQTTYDILERVGAPTLSIVLMLNISINLLSITKTRKKNGTKNLIRRVYNGTKPS